MEEKVGAGREPRRSAWPPVAAGPAPLGLLSGAALLHVGASGRRPCVARPPARSRVAPRGRRRSRERAPLHGCAALAHPASFWGSRCGLICSRFAVDLEVDLGVLEEGAVHLFA